MILVGLKRVFDKSCHFFKMLEEHFSVEVIIVCQCKTHHLSRTFSSIKSTRKVLDYFRCDAELSEHHLKTYSSLETFFRKFLSRNEFYVFIKAVKWSQKRNVETKQKTKQLSTTEIREWLVIVDIYIQWCIQSFLNPQRCHQLAPNRKFFKICASRFVLLSSVLRFLFKTFLKLLKFTLQNTLFRG